MKIIHTEELLHFPSGGCHPEMDYFLITARSGMCYSINPTICQQLRCLAYK